VCAFSCTIVQVFCIFKHVDRHGWGLLRFVVDDNNVCVYVFMYI